MSKGYISVAVNIRNAVKWLEDCGKKAEKGLATSTQHAAAIISRNAKDLLSVQRRDRLATPAGNPPRRRSGGLQRSIKYEALPGQAARVYSEYEGRGKRKGNDFVARLMEKGLPGFFPPHPFVKPAVEKSLSRLPILMRTELDNALK